MKTHRIRTLLHLPVVPVVVVGPKTARRVELIFDSGAATTQIHIGTLKAIGFDYSKRQPDISMQGVTGAPEGGFSTQLPRLHMLGKRYDQSEIGAFDFSRWINDGIDGLLGWDLIEKLHFEVDGPHKVLKIF